MLSSLGFRRMCLLLVIVFLFPFLKVEAMQIAAGRLGVAKARRGSAAPDTGEAPKPQLLNADSNPTLRYPVSVDENSSISCGWLDVTRSGVTYTVVESGSKGRGTYGKKFMGSGGDQYLVAPAESTGSEGFDVRLSEIQDIRLLEGSFLRIAFGGRKPLLIYLPQDFGGL
jgi:hypothetical protein